MESAAFVRQGPVDVCAIIVTYNSAGDIKGLIDSLRQEAAYTRIRVVVVDNASTDNTLGVLGPEEDVLAVPAGGNLGYAGGINHAWPYAQDSRYILVLNPDLRLKRGCVRSLLTRAALTRAGAVVPLMLDADGAIYPSIRREPAVLRSLGDALLGKHLAHRPALLGELEYRESEYGRAHPIDWATGAALMVPTETARAVGPWREEYFLYSEEVDYLRRTRELGHEVWFEPDAQVVHRGGGSGTSDRLVALMTVNRVRYFRDHHHRLQTAIFGATVVLAELLRIHKPQHRFALRALVSAQVRRSLPAASRSAVRDGELQNSFMLKPHGSIVMPAHNEEAVIERSLSPIARLTNPEQFEVVVVCNGCTDRTAEIARTYSGVRVVEGERASKTWALNEGDRKASLWPRLYLDADIEISPDTVHSLFATLAQQGVLAARPSSVYDVSEASALVRSYYRARSRIASLHTHLWGAGAYAMTRAGRERFPDFPDVISDDLWIDLQFEQHEKAVSDSAPPVVVRTPRNVRTLVRVLRRGYRGNRALAHDAHALGASPASSYACDLAASTRSPLQLVDALTYVSVSLVARFLARWDTGVWERDETSRVRTEGSYAR